MNFKSIFFYLGKINLLIVLFSFINILYCYYFDFKINLSIYFITFLLSLLFYLGTFKIKSNHKNLKSESLIFFAVIGWIVLPLLMSMPFWLGNYANFLNAYFETMSGFTSFGASIFDQKSPTLDAPILLWRNSTQIIGSVFFVVTIILVLGNRDL